MNTQGNTDYTHVREKIVAPSLLVFVVMTMLVGYSCFWNFRNIESSKLNLALFEARANWKKDVAFRQWATRHGGLYVSPDERTPPNPALAHIPDRDVITTDGKKLTLMNPAYMMRQMTAEFEEGYGIKGKITGKRQLNVINAPDSWERQALDIFERGGVEEVVEQTDINGDPFLRFMKPMYMTEGCVKCHGILGYRDGDLRGGVSISIPMKPYLAAARDSNWGILTTHLVVWIVGVMVILLLAKLFGTLLSRMAHDALHDALTGLPNMSLFKDRVSQAISKRRRNSGYQFAVCFLDLDRFKDLNDSHGHRMGDLLLQQLADVFVKVVRPSDTVARMGGDEFTFLVDNLSGVDEMLEVAQRILDSVETPLEVNGHRLYISASIGICMADGQHSSAESMVRDADIAMYRAKAAGKGRKEVFNPQMHRHALETLQIETDLREAIDREQLEVHYQPIIDIANNRITGFEALLRWRHPTLGNIPPDRFIPVAEHTGQIGRIGNWVLETACTRMRDWNLRYNPDRHFSLAVNLSGVQLSDDELCSQIIGTLNYTRFCPDDLHVEVTETMLLTHKDVARNTLQSLRELGVSVSIDDFGTGYCSLSYLQDFHFDTLKIDRSFVQDMGASGRGRPLIRALMLMARDLKLQVLAEGVETEAQLNRLAAMKCPLIQGYYFSKPLPAAAIEQLLTEGAHLDARRLAEAQIREQAL